MPPSLSGTGVAYGNFQQFPVGSTWIVGPISVPVNNQTTTAIEADFTSLNVKVLKNLKYWLACIWSLWCSILRFCGKGLGLGVGVYPKPFTSLNVKAL